jgi:hypothetical protein
MAAGGKPGCWRLQAVLFRGRHQRPPSVVVDEQPGGFRRGLKRLHVPLELARHVAFGSDAQHGRLAHEPVSDRAAWIVAERQHGVGVRIVSAGEFNAPKRIAQEYRLAEPLVRRLALNAHVPDIHAPQWQRAFRLQHNLPPQEEVAVAERVLQLDRRLAPITGQLQHDPLAALRQCFLADVPEGKVGRRERFPAF